MCVDSSALVAIAAGEPLHELCSDQLAAADQVLISAATLAEAMIVCGRRRISAELDRLQHTVDLVVVDVDEAAARRVAAAYGRWGKGVDPAQLNYGDCFAYEVAQRYGCPLLFVGDDFAKTDVRSAL